MGLAPTRRRFWRHCGILGSVCRRAARGPWRGSLFTLIFRHIPDGWKIVHDHTSVETPPGPK